MRLSEQKRELEKLNVENENNKKYKIIAVDDEIGIIDSLTVFLKHSGYTLVGCTNPYEAIEKVKNEHFDLMLLDFMMDPIHGDTVVEEIRKFNKELYIILLTGHRSLVPPLETIKKLSIQAYCEKEDKFDQLLLLIESAFKSIEQMQTIKDINEELKEQKEIVEKAYLETIEFFEKEGVLENYKKELSWRVLKSTHDSALYPDKYNEFLTIYPSAHKYIWSCPFVNFKCKCIMTLLSSRLLRPFGRLLIYIRSRIR